MVDRVMALPEGTRAYLLAPAVRGRKGEYRKEIAEWQKAGYTRLRIDGEMYAIEDAPALDKKYKHDIEVVVDRVAVKDGIQSRLADSFEQALKLADGLAYIDLADGVVPGREGEAKSKNLKGAGVPLNRIVFSEKFACPVSGFTIESSRVCFRSTRLRVPARPAMVWARSCCSIRNWWCPMRAVDQGGGGGALGQVEPAITLLYAGAGLAGQALRFCAGNPVA
jgi:excinuclease UvrABC ATPase subunit